jgi:hypothetical protein
MGVNLGFRLESRGHRKLIWSPRMGLCLDLDGPLASSWGESVDPFGFRRLDA